ncbi:MAG: aldo/keto reductase [Planctomycetota bacterium]
MQHRRLGNTGLEVSVLSLGTVSLGLDYGIRAPGVAGAPSDADAIRVLYAAYDSGINLFDTAPAYGESESLLGRAFGASRDVFIATKVSAALKDGDGNTFSASELRDRTRKSLENSLHVLRREVLDIVQIHSASTASLTSGEITEELLTAQKRGWIRHLGASVYGEEAAKAAIEAEIFDVLQVAYSVLDQRMETSIFPLAASRGVGILVRSALLKGALTSKAPWLPDELAALRTAAERARELLADSWESLPSAALRFCFSSPHVMSVLTGARTPEELKTSLDAEKSGPLPASLLQSGRSLALTEERLLNPSYWPIP